MINNMWAVYRCDPRYSPSFQALGTIDCDGATPPWVIKKVAENWDNVKADQIVMVVPLRWTGEAGNSLTPDFSGDRPGGLGRVVVKELTEYSVENVEMAEVLA